jgi:eukaryotic-like serine/threonine-protein kinase
VEESTSPQIIENCPSCGGAIDVTDELPFAQIYCPHCGEGMRARKVFNNFEVVELIGQGGMGSVFKAYDHTLERMVALKVLRREMSASEEERAKLEQEARVTASVNHPHVVRVYSFGEADGQFYLAMELVEKGSLDDLMAIQSRVSEAQVLEIGVQIAQGLEAAAERGLIHRDVKPGNILFADAHTTKIVDFGLARVLEEEAEARGEIWGTPYYIAPERLNYDPEDFRSDIYSLGGTLFHAIAGRPPFEAESASLVALKQIKSQPVSLEAFAPDVAPETAYVINRMLEKDPENRYGSYHELIEHLEFARAKVLERAGRPVGAKREVVKVESGRTKLYVTLISVAAALLLLGVAGWLFLTSEADGIRTMREELLADTSFDPMTQGREALAAGRWDEAQEIFGRVAARNELASARGLWSRVNLAVAQDLAGRRPEARQEWTRLKGADAFYEKQSAREASRVIRAAAETGARSGPTSALPDRSAFGGGVGALGIFYLGTVEWGDGEKQEARNLFREFMAAPVEAEIPFWGTYREVAERLLSGS